MSATQTINEKPTARINWAHYGRSADHLALQAEWEIKGVKVAEVAYRQSLQSKQTGALPSAQRFMQRVVPGFTAAIAAETTRLLSMAGKSGRVPPTAWMMPLLPPQTLAIITVCTALRSHVTPKGYREQSGALTRLSVQLAEAVRVQLEYDAFSHSEHDALEVFARQHPEVTDRIWRRWRNRLDGVRRAAWPVASAIPFGVSLLSMMALSAPDAVTIELRNSGGHTYYAMVLSPDTIGMLDDIEDRAAVARPLLLPMRIPPNPWRPA